MEPDPKAQNLDDQLTQAQAELTKANHRLMMMQEGIDNEEVVEGNPGSIARLEQGMAAVQKQLQELQEKAAQLAAIILMRKERSDGLLRQAQEAERWVDESFKRSPNRPGEDSDESDTSTDT